ncbi:MAG: MBL fold metallo-hydrolase [Oliverpabstia sp.]
MYIDYYKAEKINEHITAIRSLSHEIMYLIQGEKEAVLIDTCIGLKGYREYVERLIKGKKLTVLISHGHVDHAAGVAEFEGFSDVYMNFADIDFYKTQLEIEDRRGYAMAVYGPEAKNYKDEQFAEGKPDFPFKELKDEMEFELGGLTVQTLAAPGHTKGCMVFLIKEERILILGDACNNATFLFDEICDSLEHYLDGIRRLKEKTDGSYDRVFLMHHIIEGAPDTLAQMVEVCEDVFGGNADNIPFEFMGHKGLIAKACNEQMERMDGKFANVIYNPENMR